MTGPGTLSETTAALREIVNLPPGEERVRRLQELAASGGAAVIAQSRSWVARSGLTTDQWPVKRGTT
jgi:hypothetical protein